MRTIVWFRGKDLRIGDHAPLRAAADAGDVIPLFVLDPYFFAPARARELPHRMQFLLDSLRSLAADLADRGSRLVVVAGKSVEVVPRLARAWRADRVVAHRWVEPFARERDRRVRDALGDVPFDLHEGETLLPPGTLRTGAGRPYAVFTQFARAFERTVVVGQPLAAPRSLPALPRDLRVERVAVAIPTDAALGLTRNPAVLPGGERAARERLRRFVRGAARSYATDRDRMDRPGTSRLSADLKFGTLSVRQVWSAVARAHGDSASGRCFLNELVWREFTHSTLWDRPELLETPFQSKWIGFPWRDDDAAWRAWAEGTTGYPIVDASARQLLGEGFVHNRARMISASFLAKHLLVDFRRGEAHYLKHLTDGDWAQNDAGWQWSAGCGCDAQPYYRPRSVTVAAPAYLGRAGSPATPDDLTAHACLRFVGPGGRARDWVFVDAPGGARERALRVHGPMLIDQGEHLLGAAIAGLGVAQVLDFMARGAIARGDVVELLAPWAAPGPPIHALVAPERARTPNVRVFLDFLVDVFRAARADARADAAR